MTRSRLRWLPALVLAAGLAAGCGGASRPNDPSATPVPTVTASIPEDGITLAAFGLTHGPVRQLSIPRGSDVRVEVDQTNNVAMVIGSPPAAELYDYLRQALPAAGFTITAADRATLTLTFIGYEWNGRFTGDTRASGLLLRPS